MCSTATAFPAAILHQQDGSRLKWFEHATPVVYSKSTGLATDDYLVVPEADELNNILS